MIGIDTNLLVRIIVDDDHIQAHRAKKLIEQHTPVFVSTVVLCETFWILESRYKFTKKDLLQCIENILRSQQFDIEHRDAMWLAFSDFQHLNIGFSDCAIGAIGRIHGLEYIATFDKKAAKSKYFKLT